MKGDLLSFCVCPPQEQDFSALCGTFVWGSLLLCVQRDKVSVLPLPVTQQALHMHCLSEKNAKKGQCPPR